jgi:ankyrin repeat protein
MENMPESNVSEGFRWLNVAAKGGHVFSQALYAKFAKIWVFEKSLSDGNDWLESAARNGSKSALLQLLDTSKDSYDACLRQFRTFFWARVYGIPEDWIANIISLSTCLDWLASVDLKSQLGPYKNTLLHFTAVTGSVLAVQALLGAQDSSTLNEQNAFGDTPLLLASKSGHTNIVRDLLNAGADPRICNEVGENCVHWLSSFDENDIFDIAWTLVQADVPLNQPADVNKILIGDVARTFFHRLYPGTPLHRAVDSGNLTAVSALVNLGASTTTESHRFTPLCRAAQSGRPDILRLLLEYTPSSFDINALYPDMSGRRCMSILNRTIMRNNTLFHYISHKSHGENSIGEVISILLLRGAKVSASCFDICTSNYQYAALELLVKHNPQAILVPSTLTDRFVLLNAVILGNNRAVEIFLANGASVDCTYSFFTTGCFTALQLCAKSFHIDARITARLIKAGAKVDEARDVEASDTALWYALTWDSFHIAKALVDNGATLEKRNPKALVGNTMGHFISLVPSPITYRALKWLTNDTEVPIPLYVAIDSGKTVFHTICNQSEIAARYMREIDFKLMFNLLRDVFPDPKMLDMQDTDGWAPLQLATWGVCPIAVKALLEAGANPHIRRSGLKAMPPIEALSGMNGIDIVAAMTPVEIAAHGFFKDIPPTALFSLKEHEFYISQREKIQRLLVSC